MYWTAASTPDGNGQMMLEKWQSVANHVQNIHEHDGISMMTVPMVLWKALNDTESGLNQVINVYNITTFKAQFLNVSVLNEFVSIF